MSLVFEGASITEMKPSKYHFVKKVGKYYLFVNEHGINEIWKKITFSKPGFVLKYKGMLFEHHTNDCN